MDFSLVYVTSIVEGSTIVDCVITETRARKVQDDEKKDLIFLP